MRYDPCGGIDRLGWAGVARLLAVLFVASLVLTVGLIGSVRLGLVDGKALLDRRPADPVDWESIQRDGDLGDG